MFAVVFSLVEKYMEQRKLDDLDNANAYILEAIESDPANKEYREYQKDLELLKNGLKDAKKTFDSGYHEEALSDYDKLAEKFKDLIALNDNTYTFKISKNQNDWKFEFKIFKDNKLLFRFKIYDKTAERLSSLGVSNFEIADPFAFLVFSSDKNENVYNSIFYIIFIFTN